MGTRLAGLTRLRPALGAGRVDAGLSLRRARRDDCPGLFAWYAAAYRDHIDAIWGWDDGWQRRDFGRLFERVRPLVVVDGARDVGYLQVLWRAGALHLANIVLVAEARGAGRGGRLLGHLQARAGRLDRAVTLRVFRTNARAEAFYARHGFRRSGQSDTHVEMRWRAVGPG